HSAGKTPTGPHRRPPHRRPSLEVLEDRTLPATPGLLLKPLPPPTTLAGDFNGDGRSDVARISPTGIWQVGLSQGSYFDMNCWAGGGSRSNYQSLLVGDFNGDGKADIAGLNKKGYLLVGLSDGNSFNTSIWARWAGGPYVRLVTGDFNGDGKTDIAAFNTRGNWIVGASTGGSFN